MQIRLGIEETLRESKPGFGDWWIGILLQLQLGSRMSPHEQGAQQQRSVKRETESADIVLSTRSFGTIGWPIG